MTISSKFKGLIFAAAASAISAGGAMAADVMPIMPAPTPVVTAPAPSFDWAGPYAGIGASAQFCGRFCWVNAGGHVGYNMVFGSVLVGVEGQVAYWNNLNQDGWLLGATGRVGYVFGNAVAYAEAGFFLYFPTDDPYYVPLRLGVEVAVGQAISLFAEAGVEWAGTTPDFYPAVGLGVNFHLGH